MADNAAQRQINGLALDQTTSKQQTTTLSFSQVSYSINATNKNATQILRETCGAFNSGRLTAILGPSGAGKSTLLNVLAGFKVTGVSGQFQLNGEPRDLLAFRKISSYIPQDFVMMSLLTVEETLQVSTDLKLPTATTAQQKQKIIDGIVDILNLHACRHTLVRNISGGERKRLSMGIELVTNPPIMFFDEPTSGLDVVASFQVMSYLQRLAHDGRIVVCVVHQPSSRLMQLFDDVLVLAHGEVLYAGTQSDMLSSFEQAGFSCPNFYNPADFVLEVGCDSFAPSCATLIEQNKLRYSSRDDRSNKTAIDEQTALIEMPATQQLTVTGADLVLVRPKEQVGFCYQLRVLLRRHMRATSREFIAVQMRVVMHVMVALLLGVVYWQIGNDAARVVSNVSFLLFIVLFVFSGNAMPSILVCMQDAPIFIREYYNGWYSLRAYYISKVLGDLPLQLVCPTLFIGISYFMTGQPTELARFLMCWAICTLTALIGHFIGVIAGSLFNMQLAIFLVPTISIPFLLFSGFFIRLRELVWFLRPICDISFFRYIFEGLMRAIYGYDRGDLPCSANFCYFKTANQFLADFDMLGDEFNWDVAVLTCFLLLLLLSFYVTLHVCIRRAL